MKYLRRLFGFVKQHFVLWSSLSYCSLSVLFVHEVFYSSLISHLSFPSVDLLCFRIFFEFVFFGFFELFVCCFYYLLKNVK